MGCMGMGMDDFCRCTPSEFRAAWDAWNEMRQMREREAWEQVRMQCLCTLQPWSKERLSARDIMEFPWDDTKEKASESIPDREEILRRYRKVKREAGLE